MAKTKVYATTYSESALVAELEQWWHEEIEGQADPFAPSSAAGTIHSIAPQADSLSVVKKLVIIDQHVGIETPPTIVRRGGYNSFEDMITDLLPKIRELYEAHKKPAAA